MAHLFASIVDLNNFRNSYLKFKQLAKVPRIRPERLHSIRKVIFLFEQHLYSL